MLIRKAILSDTGAIAQVHVNSWRTTYRGLISNEFLANLSYERSESSWASFMSKNCRNHFLLVVEDPANSIVGFAAGGPIRTETIPVGIRKALHLKPGDYLTVMQVGDGIVLKKNKNKEPLSADDPIWGLLGVGNSGKGDISEQLAGVDYNQKQPGTGRNAGRGTG